MRQTSLYLLLDSLLQERKNILERDHYFHAAKYIIGSLEEVMREILDQTINEKEKFNDLKR